MLSFSLSQGQQICLDVLGTTGNSGQGNNIELSWTIGEMFVGFHNTGTIDLSEGFHQSQYCDSSTVHVENVSFLASDDCFSVIQNPWAEQIHLSVDCPDFREIKYKLIDLSGKIVLHGTANLEDSHIIIQADWVPAAIYLLALESPESNFFQYIKVLKSH